MSKRYLIALTFLLPALLSAYTSPGSPSGFVNDYAGLFGIEEKAVLEDKLVELSSGSGVEFSVVTINELDNETIETYAEKLFQEWGIGKKGEDNGLLLLISRDDREMRFEVGYGLEPIITDIESSRIIREILAPSFQKGEYGKGVVLAIERIASDIDTGEAPPEPKKIPDISAFFYPAIFLLVFLASILGVTKSWWLGGVIGGVIGVLIGLFLGFLYTGIIATVVLIPLGLLFDFLVSRSYSKHKAGGPPPWFLGGSGRGFGGGFGGFGGGMSGGGGASGRW